MRVLEIVLATVVAMSVLAGCSGRSIEAQEGVENYCYDDAEYGEDLTEVFSDVELIALEFAGEYYPQNFDRLLMTDSLIFVYDMNSRLTVFENDGKYVSSSAEKFGQGPEEFSLSLGFGWNPHSREITILGFGKIMFYDKDFNFVRSCKAPNIPGQQIITEIFDLSPTRHILLNNDANHPNIFLFDSEKGVILDRNNYQEWNIGGGPSAQRHRFFRSSDGEIYCMPLRVTDKILKLHPDSLVFEKAVCFIPGKNTITAEEFERMRSNGESCYNINRESPFYTMFNAKKIFNCVAIGSKVSSSLVYLIDRQSDKIKRYNMYDGKTMVFPRIDDIDEEYAYSVISKEVLAESPKLLMDKAEKADSILAPIEEDTYIVLKYKIKD